MSKLKSIWFFPLFCLPFLLQAQQNNIWYFGNKAGLDFTALPPTPLSNSAMVADESCASISDSLGRLLFYSNGLTVYNKSHQVMTNGDNLDGHISSYQGCVVVPQPGSDNLYYLFTGDGFENGFTKGYKYSIIDMAANGGMGVVTVKNTVLWPNCTERLTAARHANGVDVWLITNDIASNTFRSWLITCNGLQASPVVSNSGVILDGDFVFGVGMMKVSPDGRTLVQTHFPSDDGAANFFQLFDFDNATGTISNARSFAYANAKFKSAEFSPDSRFLYVVRPSESRMDQLDLSAGSVAAIIASRFSMSSAAEFYGIQLAPDQKIYMSREGSILGVINRPNTAGAGCNFVPDQVNLSSGNAKLGLPASINDLSFDPQNGFTFTIIDSCTGTIQFNGLTSMNGLIQWEWDFGDGNTSTQQNPLHTFIPADQTYKVKLKITSTQACGGRVIHRSQDIKPKGQFGEVEFTSVFRCDSGYVRFTNLSDDSTANFLWSFGDGNFSTALHPLHSYATPGNYNVKLKVNTAAACLADSVEHPVDIKTYTVQTIPTQTILVGEKVLLTAIGGGINYNWSPGDWLSDSTVKNPVAIPVKDITYKVVARNADGCLAEDSVFIKVIQLDDFYIPTGFTPNNDGKNDVIKPRYGEKFILKEFSVFNRWGQKIFSTTQRGFGWDGKINGLDQDTGVYVWVITAGGSSSKTQYKRSGTFVLIR